MNWTGIEFSKDFEPISRPAVRRLLNTFNHIYCNGHHDFFKSFEVKDPLKFESELKSGGLSHQQVLNSFFSCPSIRNGLADFELTEDSSVFPRFELISGDEIADRLDTCIVSGGAYQKFPGTHDESIEICQTFVETLLGNDLDSVVAGVSRDAWCEWFYDIIWDFTFLIWDIKRHRFYLLCITDTD